MACNLWFMGIWKFNWRSRGDCYDGNHSGDEIGVGGDGWGRLGGSRVGGYGWLSIFAPFAPFLLFISCSIQEQNSNGLSMSRPVLGVRSLDTCTWTNYLQNIFYITCGFLFSACASLKSHHTKAFDCTYCMMDREWTEKTIAVKQFVCDVDCLAEYMISRTHNILQDSRAVARLGAQGQNIEISK